MTPALAFFYGGLVRSKNALNTMMMSIISLGFVGVLWAMFGYSLAFSTGSNWIGDTSNFFLRGVALDPQGPTVLIPQVLFMAFQGTFAIITAALISGAIVERMRFSAYVLFISLWALFVYSPIAHWVWGGGWLADMGALDFAGGTVVHVNAAVAALVAAIVVGKRTEYPSTSLLPHNVPFTLLGAGLLWFGWFGFNAGSALSANGIAGLAFVTTMLAPAATLVVWTFLDAIKRQAHRGRCRHGDRRRARRGHAGGRLHRPDERDRARRHRRRPKLAGAAVARQDVAGRFARRRRGARGRRHGRRAAHRRLRTEGAERHRRRRAVRQSGSARDTGHGSRSRRSCTAAWSASSC